MRVNRLFCSLLILGTLTAAPAFARSEVAGVVQGFSGTTVFIGSAGRVYAVPGPTSTFLVGGQQVYPGSLQPGTPVQVYLVGRLHAVSDIRLGAPPYDADRWQQQRDWELEHGRY